MEQFAFKAAYWALFSVFLFWFVTNFILRTRRALIIGVTSTTFCLGALAGGIFGFHPLAVQFGVAFFVALSLLFNPESGRALRSMRNSYVLVLAIIALALFAYIPLGHNSGYGWFKATYFVLEVLIPVVAFGALSPLGEEDIRVLLRTLVMGSVLMSFLVLSHGLLSHDVGSVVALGNPITISRIVGLGAVVLLISAVAAPDSRWSRAKRILSACGGVALLALPLLLGNRGVPLAVASAVVAVSVMSHFRRARNRNVLIRAFLLVGFVWVAVLALPLDASRSDLTDEFVQKVSATGTIADDVARIGLARLAIDSFLNTSGLGLGTGGFASVAPSVTALQSGAGIGEVPGRVYPHNIFLEAIAELGIVGLVLMLAWFKKSLAGLKRIVQLGFPQTAILVGLWIFSLLNACVSGDFVSNVPVWVIGALPWFIVVDAVTRCAPQRGFSALPLVSDTARV
jgi:O-antigen ligase